MNIYQWMDLHPWWALVIGIFLSVYPFTGPVIDWFIERRDYGNQAQH